ncbi:MAG TPA: hypothetical protein VEX64_09845 [Pyrinomonadaceae bacterium]|nr:hypothetical protein [Pyrinomonadaceae bacterium]
MNRHILGFTLFVVIVKTTFLLYWGFFAPINFTSTVQKPLTVEKQATVTTKCNLKRRFSAELQNVAVDPRDGSINANIYLNKGERISSLFSLKIRLYIFNLDSGEVWSGESEPRMISPDTKNFIFNKTSSELQKLRKETNYYAHIEILGADGSSIEDPAFRTRPSTPVLLIGGKQK